MSVPKEVSRLIEKFDQHLESYRSGKYNEAQLRNEFLNPFFKALGWDLDNDQGLAEAYKDVVHEDSIRIGAAVKAPDYCFRIGGTRKFFLEAKKPSVDISQETSAAYQLRRYAWSAKLPLSILSDFEEFAVYDCRVKPNKSDSAATARVFLCRFQDYPGKWEWISSIFSKEAILKGSFDKYAEENKSKRGTSEVDDDFLATIERWRSELAKNIALRNSRLSQRELNFAVQRIIDRIIFLRICEDRGSELYGRLQGLTNGPNIYQRLCEVFEDADGKYNSGLFHFKAEKGRHEPPDEITLGLDLDDKLLRDLLRGLYYPESPYEFTVISSDILGQAYEQFLGKVIRLTEGHHAVVEDKPEVKKAGGVYYTPVYIVDYIVKQTVGKLVDGKTPKQVSKLRILDPACGSGSFLINAYQFLLDWHHDWYLAHKPETLVKGRNPVLVQTTAGWKLTITERKRILLDNIYGVDIDPQAVEVTKLSLLLKVLEGESEQTIQPYLRLFSQRALPDLGNNIKCGNSLIGPDYYQQPHLVSLTSEESQQINVFDWSREFPLICSSPSSGFNAIIGNPPYIRIQGYPRSQVNYLTTHYYSASGNCDVYVSFIERGFNLLSKDGRLGFIVPNKFFRTDYGEGIRRLISEKNAVTQVVDFGASQVFPATTYTCLLFLQKPGTTDFSFTESQASPLALSRICFSSHKSSELGDQPWTFHDKEIRSLIEKLADESIRLLELPAHISRGSSTGADEVFIIEKGNKDVESAILREPLFATDFGRYVLRPKNRKRIIFPYIKDKDKFHLISEKVLQENYPKTYTYLKTNIAALRRRKQYKDWYGYSAPRNLGLHDKAHIAVPLLANKGIFVIIPDEMRGRFCPMASGGFTISIAEGVGLQPEYILGLLNSSLLFWRLRLSSNVFRGGWITCTKQYFGELPIRRIDFSIDKDKEIYDKIIYNVKMITQLQQQLMATKIPHDQELVNRQIEVTNGKIDNLVYGLYGLTEKEISLVEGTR